MRDLLFFFCFSFLKKKLVPTTRGVDFLSDQCARRTLFLVGSPVLVAESRGVDPVQPLAGATVFETGTRAAHQQRQALEQRLGAERASSLLPYLERMPVDERTQERITANPLMLSMVACQTRYTQERVLQAAPAQCADARADLVHGGYLRHARALDARHHAGVRDPDARPILQRLLQYPAVRGDCVGAFGECSRDLHSLLHDTVRSAAERLLPRDGSIWADSHSPLSGSSRLKPVGCTSVLVYLGN